MPISENDDEEKELKLKNNTIVYNNEISNYKLNLSDYLDNENKTKDLLIYTNFTEENIYYYFDNSNNNENISLSTFDIVKNQTIQKYHNSSLVIVINSTKSNGIGFIDFSFEDPGLFEVNKNMIREAFYNNKKIDIQKNINFSKCYINLIPTDNNSDAYFLQFTSTVPKEEKDTLNLYYLNSVDQTSIEGVKTALKNKPLKRDKKINGKIEIFAYEYSGENDRELTLNYNRIKGEGIAGFITSISALFFILIIIVIIFLKNTYS